jgi:hypothetical protein
MFTFMVMEKAKQGTAEADSKLNHLLSAGFFLVLPLNPEDHTPHTVSVEITLVLKTTRKFCYAYPSITMLIWSQRCNGDRFDKLQFFVHKIWEIGSK